VISFWQDAAANVFGRKFNNERFPQGRANNESPEAVDILLRVILHFNPLTRLDNVKNF